MSDDPAALPPNVINVEDAVEEAGFDGERWGHRWKVLTPSMRGDGDTLADVAASARWRE